MTMGFCLFYISDLATLMKLVKLISKVDNINDVTCCLTLNDFKWECEMLEHINALKIRFPLFFVSVLVLLMITS